MSIKKPDVVADESEKSEDNRKHARRNTLVGAYSAMDAAAAAALHVDGVSVSAAERQQPVLE